MDRRVPLPALRGALGAGHHPAARSRALTPAARRAVTVAEAARALHLSETGVYYRIKSGKITAIPVRGRYVIPRSELARHIWESRYSLRH